jgi:hypothetical protein
MPKVTDLPPMSATSSPVGILTVAGLGSGGPEAQLGRAVERRLLA